MFVEQIENTQAWRESKAEEFPDDSRNRPAAEALAAFAAYVRRVEDEGPDGDDWAALDRLRPHLDPGLGTRLSGRAAERELSRYGFGYSVNESTHQEFLNDLWIACMEDAYDYASERVDAGRASDWTGELFPIEVEAADHQVSLPYNYWQRRGRTFEADLEAELEPLIAAAKAEDE
jgi:hypothetical protein